MSQSEIDKLLGKFDVTGDSNNKYFMIFDIDGTLRPDSIGSEDHRHPKIPPKTAQQIKHLNTHPNFDIVVLTARTYADIFKSNFPKDIIKYCGCGKQILDNDIIKYPREEFQNSYNETIAFIDILKDILGKSLVSKIDFLVAPGDFAIYFDRKEYAESKKLIMEKVNLLLENSSRWQITDHGRELIFIDKKYLYNKGDAVTDIMAELDFEELTYVFMFGDSELDYDAMVSLRKYQKDNPEKRMKVNNISIGDNLKDHLDIDFRFDSYQSTIDFIDKLHVKLYSR